MVYDCFYILLLLASSLRLDASLSFKTIGNPMVLNGKYLRVVYPRQHSRVLNHNPYGLKHSRLIISRVK